MSSSQQSQDPNPSNYANEVRQFAQAYREVKQEIMQKESGKLSDEVAMEFMREAPQPVLDAIHEAVISELKDEIHREHGEKIREEIKERMRQDFYTRIAANDEGFFNAASFQAFLIKDLALTKAANPISGADLTIASLSDIEKEKLLCRYIISEMLIKGGLA